MKPILVPYDENMTKEELLKEIAYAVGSDVETVKKELCEPKDEPQTDCETCRYGQDKHRYAHICNECGVGINNYEPKTEPQTERSE